MERTVALHRLLENALRRRRTGVAWLVRGDNDAGIRRETDTYLRSLFCDHGTGCGTCPGCQKYDSGSHVDLLRVEGTKVDDVRELAPFAARHAFEGEIKAISILHADELTEQAQNALLKLLEEPPEDTVIVLGAQNRDAVLPTILSRCTVLEAPPDSDHAPERIAAEAQVSIEQARALAAAASGDYAGAMQLHEDGYLAARTDAVQAVHRILTAKSMATSKIEKLLKGDGDRLELSLQAALLYLEDVLAAHFGAGPDTRLNPDLEQQIVADSAAPARRITAATTRLHELIERLHACRGLNRQIGLQGMLLTLLEETV